MRRHSDFNRTGRSSPRRCSQLSLFPPTTVIWLQIPPKGLRKYVDFHIIGFFILALGSRIWRLDYQLRKWPLCGL